MAFRIASESKDEVLLVRRAWSAPLLFMATCSAFLFGLTVLALVRFPVPKALLPAGLTLVSLGLFALFLRNHRSLPKALRFAPATASVELLEQAGHRTTVSLYDLTGVGTIRRPRGRYAVALTFGDGSSWELDYFAFRRGAERMSLRLRNNLTTKLSKAKPARPIERTGAVPFAVGEDGASFVWRERFSAKVLGAANLLFLGIATSALGLAYFQGIEAQGAHFLWGAYALIQGVGLLAMVSAFFLRHEILVTNDAVEFRTAMISRTREERDRREGKARPRAELVFPRSRLAALAVSLEPDRGVHRLRMLTPDDVDVLSELRRADIGLWQRFRLNRRAQRIIRLPLFGLSFGSALELRSLLSERAR